LPNVPDENAFAEPIVGRLRPRTRTWDRAAAHVKPLALEVPLLNVGHGSPLSARAADVTIEQHYPEQGLK
jgi:hypothetical protein